VAAALLLARADLFYLQDPNTIPVYSGVGLPIMPEVTPGIAVAGVLLMLAGLPLCLIGIKKTKWVYFRFSLGTFNLCYSRT